MSSTLPRTIAVIVVAALVGTWLRLPLGDPAPANAAPRGGIKPNIVLVLTDDQRLGTLWAMKGVRQLAARGITFRNAIVPDPLCCPARASILSGRYAVGHGVWANDPPFGWQAFQDAGTENHTVATALQAAGYRTGLVGKYLNGYNLAEGFVPPGWDRWFALHGGDGAFYDYEVVDFDSADGVIEERHFGAAPWDYSTSVIAREAERFIRRTPVGQPLFLYAAVRAPHHPSTPAPGDADAFGGREWRHGPAFNEQDVRDKPRYIRNEERFSPIQVHRLELRVKRAAQSLLEVDRMLTRLVDALRETHRLTNTMVVFTSDNGFTRGEHRWEYKVVPYEGSIRVPMVVRYDPLLRGTRRMGTVTDALVANVDLAPTWARIGGTSMDVPVDGVPFDPILAGRPGLRSDVLLESYEFRSARRSIVPSYCGLRTMNRKYVRYATGEQEFYRLDKDPAELRNLAASRPLAMAAMRHRTRVLCSPTPPAFSWPA